MISDRQPLPNEALGCDVCFVSDSRSIPEPAFTTFGPRVAPEIRAAMLAIARRGLTLCQQCDPEIRAGREMSLRQHLRSVSERWSPNPSARTPLYAHSEIAITLASWTVQPFEHLAYTGGFKLLNALLVRFPRAIHPDGAPASELERNLGNGVIGVFTVINGILYVENFVSQQRGKKYASQALQRLCALADAEGCAMSGVVQPNSYVGLPIGMNSKALHRWYKRYGFERGGENTNVVFRKPRPSQANDSIRAKRGQVLKSLSDVQQA